MIIRERVGASVLVSREYLAHPAALEAVADRLASAVIREADKSAWLVRPESVAVFAAGDVPEQDQVRYAAIWSPRTARFVGGAYDGDERAVRRSPSTGLPPELITLPYRDGASWVSAAPSTVSAHPNYSRAGTHPIDDVWIYELI